MKKTLSFILSLILVGFLTTSCSHDYESVPDDPMESRIYTLDNGLKIYLTVNKDQPRIQTYIAVRVGGTQEAVQHSYVMEHRED